MDLVFFGSGAFGLPTLQRLVASHTVRAVITQPDRPAGRGGKLAPTPIGEWAAAHASHIPLHKPEKVNVGEVLEAVRAYSADAWVVIAFGQKLSQRLLADRFAINLHASLLPRWRGAAPINAAIVAGDTQTGNSVITLADKMDAGLVLGQSKRDIPLAATAGELHDQLAADGPDLVEAVLAAHRAGTLVTQVQDEALVTIAGKLSKADGWLDFSRSADECRCRVHGLTPWPGVTVKLNGQDLKILRCAALGDAAGTAPFGVVLDAKLGHISTARGTLQLLEVQPAGRKAMSWGDFARGHQLVPGAQIDGGAPSRSGSVSAPRAGGAA